MTNTRHRLEGLEPDNLLAFVALLGLLRSLEAADHQRSAREKLRPRAAWDLDNSPLRPLLRLAVPTSKQAVTEAAATGLATVAVSHDLGKANRPDLSYLSAEARAILQDAARTANASAHGQADLLAALMSDGAIKQNKNPAAALVQPTPFCLLFGQGHQHFLERLIKVPNEEAPPRAAKAKPPNRCLQRNVSPKPCSHHGSARTLPSHSAGTPKRMYGMHLWRETPQIPQTNLVRSMVPTAWPQSAWLPSHSFRRCELVGYAPPSSGVLLKPMASHSRGPSGASLPLYRLFVRYLATQICASSIVLLT